MSASSPVPDGRPPALRDCRQAALLARRIVPIGDFGIVSLLLDDESWPIGSFVIDGASGAGPLLQAADLVAKVAVDSPQLARLVLIDVRDGSCSAGDLDVLLEAATLLAPIGVELVELIILTAEMYVPVGALSGLGSRW